MLRVRSERGRKRATSPVLEYRPFGSRLAGEPDADRSMPSLPPGSSISEQVDWLTAGTADIVPRAELTSRLEEARRTGCRLRVKLGMDPTAPDLHLGHSLVLRKLRDFQDLGHEAILIIGDFTAMIGDPTGRSATRKPLSLEQVRANAETYRQQAFKILDPERTSLVFNNDWLGALRFDDLVRLTSHYTVARLLERDDFAKRAQEQQPIAVHEFLYAFAQAYDSVHLKADIELGATDQRFNILMGRSIQESYDIRPQVAVLMPILVGLDGIQKMSKSLDNYVGLADPPELMFARLMSIGDDLMPGYMGLLTDLGEEGLQLAKQDPMAAKKLLARQVTETYHGSEAASAAKEQWERIHSRRELPDEMDEWPAPAELAGESGAVWLARLMVASGLAQGSREARRLIAQEAVRVNGEKVTDPDAEIPLSDGTVLQVGRRRFVRVRTG